MPPQQHAPQQTAAAARKGANLAESLGSQNIQIGGKKIDYAAIVTLDHEDHKQGVKAGQHECGEPLLQDRACANRQEHDEHVPADGTIVAYYNQVQAHKRTTPATPAAPAGPDPFQNNGWQFGVPAPQQQSSTDTSNWQFGAPNPPAPAAPARLSLMESRGHMHARWMALAGRCAATHSDAACWSAQSALQERPARAAWLASAQAARTTPGARPRTLALGVAPVWIGAAGAWALMRGREHTLPQCAWVAGGAHCASSPARMTTLMLLCLGVAAIHSTAPAIVTVVPSVATGPKNTNAAISPHPR